MDTVEYVKRAVNLESNDFSLIANRLCKQGNIRLLHAAIGMQTESAEFTDSLKKQFFYGRIMNPTNLAEEIGDILWYCAIAADELGVSFEDIMTKNIAKLEERYKGGFSETKAENRDLNKEREILEGKENVE